MPANAFQRDLKSLRMPRGFAMVAGPDVHGRAASTSRRITTEILVVATNMLSPLQELAVIWAVSWVVAADTASAFARSDG